MNALPAYWWRNNAIRSCSESESPFSSWIGSPRTLSASLCRTWCTGAGHMSVSPDAVRGAGDTTATRMTVADWTSLKRRRPITMLTGYDFSLAGVLDAVAELDVILVGDSVANVVYGHASTREVRWLW